MIVFARLQPCTAAVVTTVATGLCLALAAFPARAQFYNVTGLGIDAAVRINSAGEIAGNSDVYDAQNNFVGKYAFLYHNGSLTRLPAYANDDGSPVYALATGINDAGSVVGYDWITGAQGRLKARVGFVSDGSTLTDIGNLGTDANGYHSTYANDINNRGQIVGTTSDYDSSHVSQGRIAFVEEQGKFTRLGSFGTDSAGRAYSSANAINESGQAAGSAFVYDASHVRKGEAAFLYSSSNLTNVGNFGTDAQGAGHSFAYDLNNAGDVVGSSEVFDGGGNSNGSAAFLYHNGTLLNLGVLGDASHYTGGAPYGSSAAAINNAGVIVGNTWVNAVPGDTNTHAFVYQHNLMTDLNTLIAADAGWQLEYATDVNDSGLIVGYGLHNGKTEGFLLTPQAIPETDARVTFGIAFICGALFLRRTRRKAFITDLPRHVRRL